MEVATWVAVHPVASGEPAWAGAVLKIPRRCMGRLRGFGLTGAALFYGELPNPEASMKDDYKVGYKKPPKEHQFKPGEPRRESKKRGQPGETALDLSRLFAKPYQVKRAGKTIAVHPYEAELTSLGKRALKGEPRATKLFLKRCESAGLLDPPPAQQSQNVFWMPKGVNQAILRVLLESYGFPPWDPEIYAALEAEHERDCAHIAELHKQFLEKLENE